MTDEWEPRMVRRPDGAKRAKAKGGQGTDRELMYDSDGKLLGPAESREPDEGELERLLGLDQYPPIYNNNELTPRQQAAADALGNAFAEILATIAQEVAVPIMKDYVIPALNERVSEAIEAARTNATERRERRHGRKAAITAAATFASGDTVAEAEPTITMTGEQFREHVRLNSRAQQWVDQHKDMLSRVVVDDGQLTPQLQDAIRLVLDGRSHELDDDLLAQLTDYFADTEPNQTALPAAKPKKHRRQPERGSQPTD